MLVFGSSPPGTLQAIPKHGCIPQSIFQVLLAAAGGCDGLMYRSTQNGSARVLPLFVIVTLIVTGSPAANVDLLGLRRTLLVRSAAWCLPTSGKKAYVMADSAPLWVSTVTFPALSSDSKNAATLPPAAGAGKVAS